MKKNNQRQQPVRVNPTAQNKQNKQNKQRKRNIWLAVSGIVVLLAIVIFAGGTYINDLLNLVDRSPETSDPSDLFENEETFDVEDDTLAIIDADKEFAKAQKISVPKDANVYNILLIGTDQRAGESSGRSDAMIIMSINRNTNTIHLTSLMRAMYVAIPGRGWSMLNHSYAWGGASLLLQTIEDNLRIHIDDYMVIRFDGFTKAIDRVGGVTINLSNAEAKYLGLKAGENRLKGSKALDYARIRKIDSDFERTGRQRKVIEALIKETRALNLTELTNLAGDLLPLVKTNLSNVQLISLMTKMVSARNFPVKQLMLPLKEHRQMIYVRKMEMYRIDFVKTIKTLHEFIYGS